MAAAGPPVRLEVPPGQNVQPIEFGILSATEVIDEPQIAHWRNGLEWEPYACGPAMVTAADCPDFEGGAAPVIPPKVFANGAGPPATALPFTVYTTYDCALLSRSFGDARDRARRHLDDGEERAIERAISSSDMGNEPTFESAATEDLTPVGMTPTVLGALTILEDYLARCSGGRGVIHMTRGVVPSLCNGGLLMHETVNGRKRLFTCLGTPVVAGAGYDFNSPAGVAPPPGEAWMYVTSPVIVWRGEANTYPPDGQEWEGVHTPLNDLNVLVERDYVVGWDPCCQAAVRAQIGCCC